MNKVEFKCKIITPMFLAGVDKNKPEIRPPSIKGGMRFWWRSVNGGLGLKNMKGKETKIFGGSTVEELKSKISIRVKNQPSETYKYSPVPHKGNKFAFIALKPEQSFTVIISSNSEEMFEIGKNTFILLSILGGIGRRSRRGFGSFEIENLTVNLAYIIDVINKISKTKYSIEDKKIVLKSQVNMKYPYLKEIQIGKGYSNMDSLLKKIGESSHKNANNALGYAKGKNRLASPIYVSAIKSGSKLKPIMSTLNFADFKQDRNIDYKKQESFKEMIL